MFYGFGDVRKMSGPDAFRIAFRIRNYFSFDNEGNPKSSIVKSINELRELAEHEPSEEQDDVAQTERREPRVATAEQLAITSALAHDPMDVYNVPIGEVVTLKS